MANVTDMSADMQHEKSEIGHGNELAAVEAFRNIVVGKISTIRQKIASGIVLFSRAFLCRIIHKL